MTKIKDLSKLYDTEKEKIKALGLRFNMKASAFIGSFLLASLILAAPIAMLINLLYFLEYLFLTILGLVIVAVLMVFLVEKFYYEAINSHLEEENKINAKLIIKLDLIIIFGILFLLYLIAFVIWG